MNGSLRILHTSDWHLGQYLMSRDRKDEHRRFLAWLLDSIKKQDIDVLLICGDVFDTATPPNYALRLFFDFLHQIPETPCRKVVVIGGNHDSIATLHAPRKLLRRLQIHVVGGPSAAVEDDVVTALGKNGDPAAIICAVPFLRERDLRSSVPGENHEQKSRALLEGVRNHYGQALAAAERLRAQLGPEFSKIPLIATGHLFAAGGCASEGVRDLYVGSLGEIPAGILPDGFDYIALGHLHRQQTVQGRLHYCGSPIALSFSEARGGKVVKLIEFADDSPVPRVSALAVPCFRKLGVVRGRIDEIRARLQKYGDEAADGGTTWIEVQVEGESQAIDLQGVIAEAAEGLPVEILAVRRVKTEGQAGLAQDDATESLDELSPGDVFARRLAMEEGLTDEERGGLSLAFAEALQLLHEEEGA